MNNKQKIIIGSCIGVLILLGSFLISGNLTFDDLAPKFLSGIVSASSLYSEISIDYRGDNMTIEFKEDNIIIGEATLKSHKTYDEVLEITSGKNKTVIWYEFSDFKEDYESALKSVEFVDMREFVENKAYTEKFNGDLEKMNESLIMIPNPNYLLPVEKDYKFVFQDEKGEWLDYNSFDIPKENMLLGVQTDLGWGEFIDVRLNIFENKLDRHALVLGVSSGFVTEAPTENPSGDGTGTADTLAWAFKDTAPIGAIKVTEIGWWCDGATQEANFEVGIYDHNSDDDNPENLLAGADQTNAKGTTAGWKRATGLNITISGDTIYWIAFQLDNTNTATSTDWGITGGTKVDYKTTQTTLPQPWGVTTNTFAWLLGIYAVYETAAVDTTPPTYSDAQSNTTIAGEQVLFSILYNDDTALHPNGQYIFSTNNTGTWTNESAVNFTATPQWANVTKTLNSTIGNYIGYRWYAFDNVGNVNNTEIFYLTTTSTPSDTCTCPSIDTNWEIDLTDSCIISDACNLGTGNITFINTGNITFNNSITACQIGGLPADQKGFLGNLAKVTLGGSC